jgi:hypothetical protein
MKSPEKSSLLVIGMLSLTCAILLHRYVSSSSFVDFIEGLLFGISIAANLGHVVQLRRNKNSQL